MRLASEDRDGFDLSESVMLRRVLGIAIAGAALATALPAVAQDKQPISILVGFAPGGSEDTRARVLAQKMTEIMGRPVLVLNKAGASGTLALSQLAKARPDGLTIGSITGSPLIYAAHMLKSDFTVSDFTYLAGAASQPYCICVAADSRWKTFDDLMAEAKRRPEAVTYAHPGIGHFSNIIVEVVNKERGVTMTAVPFKGDTESINAVLGGHVDVASLASTFVPLAKAGKLRVLALINDKRLAQFPDAPTLKELGLKADVQSASLLGFGAPNGLPADVKRELEDALAKAIRSPEFATALEQLDSQVFYRSGADFGREVLEVKQAADRMMQEVGL
jgi:tripartite-type tricarboxylate transporter receptor subunit TctC